MGLLNSLVAILAVKILFLEMNKWHVNAVAIPNELFLPSYVPSISSNSNCKEIISFKTPDFIPYIETYRLSEMSTHYFQIKNRINYRRQYHNKLTCCEGYIRVAFSCIPHCPRSCEKGTCKKPDVCTCNEGYRMSNDANDGDSCVPVCSNGCVNGTCVDPEVCSCNDGYWMDSDGFTCRPVCDAECERNHGYCSEPNVCTCRSGYKRTGNDSSSFTCEPICDHACINGHCVAPNTCMCADGYEVEDDSYFICKPKCNESCIFGTCTAPGTCTCDHGYKAANASVCEPICSEPCVMGTCVAPESCSCNEGYGHRDGNSAYVCEPICEHDCGDGRCTVSGLCTCNKGFVYNETDRTCKPHCLIFCGPNGECTSPNNCTCFEGYRLSQFMDSYLFFVTEIMSHAPLPHIDVCKPVCNFNCIGGTCIAPNVCACSQDYYPSWDDSHLQSLDNSTSRVCIRRTEPACDEFSCGYNATCNASRVCVCNDGYVKDAVRGCVPVCVQGCPNGTCTAPNRCACDHGFALRNESFCEPICERGCQNGDCVGPDHCLCHDDFVPNVVHHSGPECIPACARNCSGHGGCVINHDLDYRCECHFGWTGWDCDQPTVCVITMTYNHDDVNRITIRNDTNSTIMRVHEDAPYCYQCSNSLNNETLCYVVHSDEGNMTSTLGCLLSTDLPCYMPRYNASINVTKIVWPFVTIAILLATGLTAAAYLKYRKRQKKKLAIGTSTNIFVRESFATEFLLPENEI